MKKTLLRMTACAALMALCLLAQKEARAAPSVTIEYRCTDEGISSASLPTFRFGQILTNSDGVIHLSGTDVIGVNIGFTSYEHNTLYQLLPLRAHSLECEGLDLSAKELSEALEQMKTPEGYKAPSDGPVTFTLVLEPAFAALARTYPYQTSTIATTTVANINTGVSMSDLRTPNSDTLARGVIASVGDTITMTPAPESNWRFKKWDVRFYPYRLGESLSSYEQLPASCEAKVDPVTNVLTYTMPRGNVVARAVHEESTAAHTVSFNLGGGVSSGGTDTQTVNNGGKIAKPPDPTRSGYTFCGWFTSDSHANEWDFGVALSGAHASSITLYAKWMQSALTVSFSSGGGTGSPPPAISAEYGGETAMPPNTFVKGGHIFHSWVYAGGALHPLGILKNITNDIQITASWTANELCSLNDVVNSLLGVTAQNAKEYKPQVDAAIVPLERLITTSNAMGSLTQLGHIESLHKAASTLSVSVTGGAASGVTAHNLAFSSDAEYQTVSLAIDALAQSAMKPLPAKYASYDVHPLSFACSSGAVARVPIVVEMPLPAKLSGASDIAVLSYGTSGEASVVPSLISGGNIAFPLDAFGHVYLVGVAPKQPSGDTSLLSAALKYGGATLGQCIKTDDGFAIKLSLEQAGDDLLQRLAGGDCTLHLEMHEGAKAAAGSGGQHGSAAWLSGVPTSFELNAQNGYSNSIFIEVTAENGDKSAHRITVYRQSEKLSYSVVVGPISGGALEPNKTSACEGDTVKVMLKPASGMKLEAGSLCYITPSGTTPIDETLLEFTMPASKVTLSCRFVSVGGGESAKPPRLAAFVINGQSASIDHTLGTVSLTLPFGTDLSALEPRLTAANTISTNPKSGDKTDFRSPVVYMLIGPDGTTSSYTVTVTLQSPTAVQRLWGMAGLSDNAGGASGTSSGSSSRSSSGASSIPSGYDRNGYPPSQSPNVASRSSPNAGVSNGTGVISAAPSPALKAFRAKGACLGAYEISGGYASLDIDVGSAKPGSVRLMKYDKAKGTLVTLPSSLFKLLGTRLTTSLLPDGVYGIVRK